MCVVRISQDYVQYNTVAGVDVAAEKPVSDPKIHDSLFTDTVMQGLPLPANYAVLAGAQAVK